MKGKGSNICLSRTKRTKVNAKENLEEQSNYSEESETEIRNKSLNSAKLYTGIKRKNPSSERCTFSEVEKHFSGGSDLPASMHNQLQLGEFGFDAERDDIGVSQAKDRRQSSNVQAKTNSKFRRMHKALDAQGVKSTNIAHNTNNLNEVQDQNCPMCSTTFTPSKSIEFINKHVEQCLNNEAQELTGNCVKDEEIVSDLQSLAEEQMHVATACSDNSQVRELNDKIVICQICQKDLSHMNSQRRLQHMNRCCDNVEEKQKSTRHMAQTSQLSCIICGKPFKSSQAQQRHLKKCAQQHGVSTSQVLQLVHNQEQEQQVPALVASHTATGLPSDRGASKRKTRGLTSIRNIDEETQLAMALSASIAPVKRKGRGKRKKNEGNELPALLLRSREETRQVVAVRAAQVICPQEDEGDSDDDLISSTPALAPSKLAQNTDMENISEANKTSSGDRIEANVKIQDEGSEVIGVAASTDVAISSTAASDDINQTDVPQSMCCSENEQSRIAVCAALSQSFVSFLQEEEAADVTSKPSEPKATFCPLWSLTALDANNPSTQEFYVPRLLPKKSTENVSKYSARKSSKTSMSPANQTATPQQNDAMISDSTVASRTLHEPNAAGGCASEEITPSQEVDALILADLADSVDVRDISIATQRMGSCDAGEFPASGFCLPVEGAPKDMLGFSSQVQHNMPDEGVQHLLQELTAMIGNSSLSDVILVTKGNYQIPAHSFMLSFRSNTLAEMLRSQTMTGLHQNHIEESGETRRCLLRFEETEPVVMEAALNFIYTGVVQVPVSWIDDVEKLSQRLQLTDLSKACEKLKEKLSCYETEGAAADEGCLIDGEDIVQVMLEKEEAGEGSDTEIKDSEYWEGFDDEDIEEIRLFQTQNIKTRTGENAEDEVIYEKGSVLSESGLLQLVGHDQNFVESIISPSEDSDGNGGNCEIHELEEIKVITEEVNEIRDGSCPDVQRETRKVSGSPAERSTIPSPDKSILPLDEEEKIDSGLAYEEFEMACDPPIDCWSDGDVGEDQVSSEETGIQETAFMFVENDSNLELYLDCESNEDGDDQAGIRNSPVVYPVQEADESIELPSEDAWDAHVHAVCSKAGKITFVAETPRSPKKTSLSVASKRKDSTRLTQKNPRTCSIESSDSSDSGGRSSHEDISCSEVEHVPHDLNSEATKFLTNLRGRVAKASKKKRSNEKQAKRTNPEVEKSPVARVALASYGTQSSSPLSSDCQAAPKRPSSMVNSPVRSPKVSRTSGLREVDVTPSHVHNTLRSSSSPSAQSPRISETASTPSRSSRNSPQFSPTMFPSPQSSPTAVRSPVVQSKYREQGEHEKYFRKDILLDISSKDLGILDESVNLDLEERDEGVDFAVDVDEHGSPSSPVIMSPPAPSPRYSFLDPPSYSDRSPSNTRRSRTAPSWDILVSCPNPPDELCCSPAGPVENQSRLPAIESPPEVNSVMRNERCIELELSAECSSSIVPTRERARNLHPAEDLCVKKADETKHKKPTVDLNLDLWQRLKAKQPGATDNNYLQAEEDCSSVEKDENSTSQNYSRMESTIKTNTRASRSARFQFHDDGGFNCDLDYTYAEIPRKDESITTTSREDIQAGKDLQSLGENVTNAEFGVTVITSDRKREQVDDDVNGKTRAQTDGTRKKPRSQKVSSDSDESSNKQSQKERRGTKTKLGKGCEKARNCGEKGAKKAMTPMPDYNDMVTPNLKKELQRFGVRALPKRKMITKLTEIYQYTHRPSSDEERTDNEVATVQLSCEGGSNEEVARAPDCQTAPATVRSESDTVRTGESGEMSDSDNSQSSDEEEFGDCTLEIASNEVTASQQVASGNLSETLLRYIQDNKELYLKILQYKPIELLSFQEQIKSDGVNCPLNKLVDFLDQQCITFTTANVRQRQRQRRKVGRKKKETHVNKS